MSPDGSLWVCIDPSQTINKAIEVPKYPSQTVDELLPNLSILCGCGQRIHKHCAGEEFFIFTMHSPNAMRCRWLPVLFGVRLGPEYQQKQHKALEGLKNVVNKVGDTLVCQRVRKG